MKKVIILLMVVFILLLFGCNSNSALSPDQVDTMTINFLKTPSDKIVYDSKTNPKKIAPFISALNKAKKIGEMDTTHPVRVTMKLKNGQEVVVWGGTQGFQTVKQGGKQYNITGEELNQFFKDLISNRNILAKTNSLIEGRVPEEIRPFITQEIDKLEDYKIIEIKGLTQSVSALKKFEPEEPKEFSAGRFLVTFQKGDEKKGIILETETKVGHLERVIPGKTVADGYILLLEKPDENSNGEKLTKPEEDYFIKMFYRKFQKPMIEEDAKLINDVKDYALAIYFNGKVGLKEYHENLKQSIQESENIINIRYGAFKISLPSEWKKKIENQSEVTFIDEKGSSRGGARVLGYYYDVPGHGWRPNHSSDISQESISTSFGEGELVILERSYPAASGKDNVLEEVHAIFPVQNQELAFDFWIKVDQSVEEDKALLKQLLENTKQIY